MNKICLNCKKFTDISVEDHGYGSLECHGDKFVHEMIVEVCSICGGTEIVAEEYQCCQECSNPIEQDDKFYIEDKVLLCHSCYHYESI